MPPGGRLLCGWTWRSIASLAAFAQFGSDQLDKVTQGQLARGQRLTGSPEQDQYVPLAVEKQVLILFVATSGMLDAVPVPEVRRFEREFLQLSRPITLRF